MYSMIDEQCFDICYGGKKYTVLITEKKVLIITEKGALEC